MKWWRFYSEALTDPKVQLLPAETFKGWVNLLCLVNETEPSRGPRSGYLPRKVEDVAYKLHGRDPEGMDKTAKLLDELVEAGLIEFNAGRYRAHNWHKRQPVSDDVSARVSKSRKHGGSNERETLHARNKRRTSTAPEGEGEERRKDPETDLDTDRETEAEAEDSRDARDGFGRRLRYFGLQRGAKVVQEALAASGPECVAHCMDEAERYNKPSWVYVDQIRRRHLRDGCPNPELLTRAERISGESRY